MERAHLVKTLKLAAPALADRSFLPQLQNFLFTGTHVVAYNDAIGIEVACEFDFSGTVDGAQMLKLLNASKIKQYNVEHANDTLVMKSGRNVLKFATMPSEGYLFSFPDISKNESILINEGFLNSLEAVLKTVGTDTTQPELLGVQLKVDKKKGVLYACDGVSITKCLVPIRNKQLISLTELLPIKFCDNLIRLGKALRPRTIKLSFSTNSLVATINDDVRLYTALPQIHEHPDFEQELKSVSGFEAVPLPTTFADAIRRSAIALGSEENKLADLTIKDGALFVKTRSSAVEVFDKFNLKDVGDLQNITVPVKVECVEKVCDICDSFWLDENFLILRNAKYLCALALAA